MILVATFILSALGLAEFRTLPNGFEYLGIASDGAVVAKQGEDVFKGIAGQSLAKVAKLAGGQVSLDQTGQLVLLKSLGEGRTHYQWPNSASVSAPDGSWPIEPGVVVFTSATSVEIHERLGVRKILVTDTVNGVGVGFDPKVTAPGPTVAGGRLARRDGQIILPFIARSALSKDLAVPKPFAHGTVSLLSGNDIFGGVALKSEANTDTFGIATSFPPSYVAWRPGQWKGSSFAALSLPTNHRSWLRYSVLPVKAFGNRIVGAAQYSTKDLAFDMSFFIWKDGKCLPLEDQCVGIPSGYVIESFIGRSSQKEAVVRLQSKDGSFVFGSLAFHLRQ